MVPWHYYDRKWISALRMGNMIDLAMKWRIGIPLDNTIDAIL